MRELNPEEKMLIAGGLRIVQERCQAAQGLLQAEGEPSAADLMKARAEQADELAGVFEGNATVRVEPTKH